MREELRDQLKEQRFRMNDEWPQLGLLTGLSPESSKEYYIKICDEVATRLGQGNVPLFTTQNVNFGLIEELMRRDEWGEVRDIIELAIDRLEGSGARAIAICSNTIHRVLEDLQYPHHVQFIHIGDCIAQEIKRHGLKRVGFLGTDFTMTADFMLNHLEQSGAEIFVPHPEERHEIDRIIFQELCHKEIRFESRQTILDSILNMIDEHQIEGVVLGCTELPLIVNQTVQERFCLEKASYKFIFFDSEKIHVAAIADFCCGKRATVEELQAKFSRKR